MSETVQGEPWDFPVGTRFEDWKMVEGYVVAELMTLDTCARCGGRHEELPFRPFTRPNPVYHSWAVCPMTGEPILGRYVADESPEPAKEASG